MAWLQAIDSSLFHWINHTLANPVLDVLMPFLSGNPFFVPAVILLAIGLLWKGGARGRIFLVLMVLALIVADPIMSRGLKEFIGRLRPFHEFADARLLVGRGSSFGMPSGHASNWFAAFMVTLIFYRRAAWVMALLACGVSFSRVYVGVHYPGDVLAGALLGAGSAAAVVFSAHGLWGSLGRRYLPDFWRRMPSLIHPGRQSMEPETPETDSHAQQRVTDPSQSWLRVGCGLILLLLLARWLYLAVGIIELSEDEAYQWLWSKHPALSYYSKPPLIAYTQLLGTSLWGDTMFGVRFFSPVIAALLSLMILRFMAAISQARMGVLLVLMTTATPLLAVGGTLMTIDPLSVLFWTAAMIAGWWAVQKNSTGWWMLTGLWMGFGFLSKYTALFQWLCWAVYFAVSPQGRRQLRRPGPYLALGINALLSLPVLIWNAQHQWVTVTHVASDGGLHQAWQPNPMHFVEFAVQEFGLLNPVFFAGAVWAAAAFWRRHKDDERLVYLFSMGAPLFLAYALFTFRSRVLPNWIAPSILPLFCLMVIYWDQYGQARANLVKKGLVTGLFLGGMVVVILHDTRLVGKLFGQSLPPKFDPLRRVQGWVETARIVDQERQKLLQEGKPVFIIGDHYGITSQLSFYLPEAKSNILTHPLVYCRSTEHPESQFNFWPGYAGRQGENAIVVRINKDIWPIYPRTKMEFSSIKYLGEREIVVQGRVVRQLQLFACRGLY